MSDPEQVPESLRPRNGRATSAAGGLNGVLYTIDLKTKSEGTL